MAQLSFDNRRYSLNLKPAREAANLLSGFGVHRLGVRFELSAIGDYPKGVLHQIGAEVWVRDVPGVSGWLGTAQIDRPQPGREFETTITMVLPITEEQLRRLEKGRAGRDLQVSLDFHAVALGGDLGWPAAEDQETITIPHAEWGKALSQIDLGAYVDVLVPITLVEGRATAARRIREAKLAITNGQYEHAVTLSRAALDAVRDACDNKVVFARAVKKKPEERDQLERWAILIQAAFQLFSGAPHDDAGSTEHFTWTRADAVAAVAVAAGLLARLEDLKAS
ncbi:hypothetical protein DN069_07765 [Streptacidiphilus pinicola]|uniref:Uncharacterized protein n=1 Tax=Streptacidiphilus pinicola TaxID=2219663 RepID=A0A2X0KHC8_9ACTN|nr:hypothetical protein [Streptacidiphilus pinicola]RAG86170.1 hypothetical protein DN069_07765 [Streptacidiphilus pinicola]